jgi:hypothetical protein
MRFHVQLAVLASFVCSASSSFAQTSDPVGPFVVDARGLIAGLPTSEGWLPALPAGSIVASRGFGFDLGAHAYPLQWGPARIGVGGGLTFARGTGTTETVEGRQEVITRSSTLAPQLSFNFGHRQGWSHLSFGYGLAKVSSEASGGALTPTTADAGWGGAINFGGGARWFIGEHVGVGFDARWHKLGSREATATTAAAPRATLFHVAVGISIH